MRILDVLTRSLVGSILIGSALLARSDARAQSTQVLRSPVVTPAATPRKVAPVPEVSPMEIRRGSLRAWFAMDSVKTSPCLWSTTCVDRWDNKADPKNPARANPSFRPILESVGGRPAVRFGLTPRPDAWHPTPTPLTFDASWLEGRPYTVIAVVNRHSSSGESYFFGTTARNCGLLGCETNTGLHIGWRHDDTLTVDQYRNALDLRVPPFAPSRVALVTATAGAGQVRLELEEAGTRAETSRASFVPLGHAREATLGLGAHYRSDPLLRVQMCSIHCFGGRILELLVYVANLDLAEDGRTRTNDAERVREYLRRKHNLPPYDKASRKGGAAR